MEKSKTIQWWAYAVLFCFCGVSLLAQRVGGDPMLPPDTFYGQWYLFILPVLAAVVLTAAGKMRGRYDFVLLLVFELLLLAWFFVPLLIDEGGINLYELPLWAVIAILSLPAIGAFILSGIAYMLVKKK